MPVSEPQKKAIRSYVNKGYSSRRIQKSLSKRHMGLRRKVLLAEIRRVKGIPKKPDTAKYTTKKVIKARWRRRAELERILEEREKKQVTVSGKHTWIDRNGRKHTENVSETKKGKGKDLFNWVKKQMEDDYWDEKPSVHS